MYTHTWPISPNWPWLYIVEHSSSLPMPPVHINVHLKEIRFRPPHPVFLSASPPTFQIPDCSSIFVVAALMFFCVPLV